MKKRGLTLFLESFTFQELNSIFHKHDTVFLQSAKTVILFSLNVVVEMVRGQVTLGVHKIGTNSTTGVGDNPRYFLCLCRIISKE